MESLLNKEKANLYNSISYKNLKKRYNSSHQITREEILKKFSDQTISQAWEIFCKSIQKNYLLGKGTIVPNFGSFTFRNPEVNFEGTTNQFIRDTKPRIPIFIMSYEFLDHIKPAIVFNGNLVHHTQFLNNSVSHVKISYAELGFLVNLNKADFNCIINNCLRLISDAIIKKSFNNKELPHIGVLLFRNGMLAVKFNEDLIHAVKELPQKLFEIKKNVQLYMETNKVDLNSGRNKKVIDTLTEYKIKSNEVIDSKSDRNFFNSNKFLNDVKKQRKRRLIDLEIPSEVLEAIFFKRNDIFNECKSRDTNNNRKLRLDDIFNVLISMELNGLLTDDMIKEIIFIYSDNGKEEELDYVNFMEALLLEIKDIIFSNRNSLLNHNSLSNLINPVSGVKYEGIISGQNLNPINNMNNHTNNFEINLSQNKLEINDLKKEIKTLRLILTKLKSKLKPNHQMMYNDFINILHDNNILFPTDKLCQVLNFLNINPQSFSLKDLSETLEETKISLNEITSNDINSGLERIRDILFLSEKTPKELYDMVSNTLFLTKDQFIKVIKLLQPNFNDLLLGTIFCYYTKMTKFMRINDFKQFFYKDPPNETFFIDSIKKINERIHNLQMSVEEYFDYLLKSVKSNSKSLNRFDFHQVIKGENYNFSSQEIYYLFKIIDMNNERKVSKENFNEKVKSIYNPVYRIQEIFRKNGLKIDEIIIKLHLDLNRNEELDYYTFKSKMSVFEKLCDGNFIQPLFMKLRNEKTDKIDTKTIYNNFNVFKVESFDEVNMDNFITNFIEFFRKRTTYHELKTVFEKRDNYWTGYLDKIDILRCFGLLKYNNDFKDEDILNFIKFNNISETPKIKYGEILDVIFKQSVANSENEFKQIVSLLNSEFNDKCERKAISIFGKIKGANFISNDFKKIFISYSEMINYLKKIIKENGFIIKKLSRFMSKLDNDGDGKIGYEDMALILNIDLNNKRINYCNDVQVQSEAEEIKNENAIFTKFESWVIQNLNKMSDDEMFNIIDYDCDGILSIYDFSTFLKQKLFVKENDFNKTTVESIFQIINMRLDQKTVKLYDFKEFYKKFKCSKKLTNIKSKLNSKSTSNLMNSMTNFPIIRTELSLNNNDKIESNNKIKNNLNQVLNNFGQYLSNNFSSLEEFMNLFNEMIMSFDDFQKFLIENNSKIDSTTNFAKNEEILTQLFNYFDYDNKGHINLKNLNSKFNGVDNLDTMHIEIKDYLKNNFSTSLEAYKNFFGDIKNNTSKVSVSKSWNSSRTPIANFLSKQGFINALNNYFPNKYSINQYHSYLTRNFKNPDKITYLEFNSLYSNIPAKSDVFYKTSSVPLFKKNRSENAGSNYYEIDPMTKLKKMLKLSRYEPLESLKIYDIVSDGKLNSNEFRNMLKRLNLGLTSLEVEKLVSNIQKNKDGLIDLKDFIKITKNEDNPESSNEMGQFIRKIKNLINKFYSSPLIAFQFNEIDRKKFITFESFKTFFVDLFSKDNCEIPANYLIKAAFDQIDFKRDGVIDFSEWSKVFGGIEGNNEKSNTKTDFTKNIRQFDSPKDNLDIYSMINKNKNVIKEISRTYLIRPNFIHSENFIKILKEAFPNANISNTQWKIVIAIGDKDKNGQVDVDLFFDLISNCSKISSSVPKIVR